MNTKDLLPSGSSGSQRIATVALQTTLQEAAVPAPGYFDLVAYLSVTLGFSPKKYIALHVLGGWQVPEIPLKVP